MALPTALNAQISDAVAQSGTAVLAAAPPMAQGAVYQSLAHSTGILYESAVTAFHQACIAGQAAANQGVIQIYSVGSMAGATATRRIARIEPAQTVLLDAGGTPGSSALGLGLGGDGV